jgi:hypothetical protein
MTSANPLAEAGSLSPPEPVVEISRPDGTAPLRVPVTIHSLSQGGVTLGVTIPWIVDAWEPFRGQKCTLNLQDRNNLEITAINGKISWVKATSLDLSAVSLGVELISPSPQALKRLSDQLVHTPVDIKGLWERYDQVKQAPAPSRLMQHSYIAVVGLLVGGVLIQVAAPHPYKMFGWGFWLLGSLGIALTVLRSLRAKRGMPSPDGKSPRKI